MWRSLQDWQFYLHFALSALTILRPVQKSNPGTGGHHVERKKISPQELEQLRKRIAEEES